MKIERIKVGYLQANCYILTKDNKSIIIDPGAELEKILKHCKEKNIVGILITHHHFDHIGALKELKIEYGVEAPLKVFIFKKFPLLDIQMIP